jgi:hypothetical protein
MIARRQLLGGAALAALAPARALAQDPFAPAAIAAIFEWLDGLPPLLTGGPGAAAVERRVEAALQAAGFETHDLAVTVPGFRPSAARLAWDGGSAEVRPQYPVVVTGAAGIEAPLALWRDPSDTPRVRDRIVLLMLPSARHSQLASPVIAKPLAAVAAAGARAVILVTDGPTGETIAVNAGLAPLVSVPVATLGPVPGAPALAAAGSPARLVIAGDPVPATGRTIWGLRDAPGPALVVSTPMTGWTRAVAERGPGLALFLALAHWAPAALPGRRLLFVATTAHEFDNEGGKAFLKRAAPRPPETALWVHLGAGFAALDAHVIGRHRLQPLPSVDAQRFLVGTEETLPVLARAFAGQPGLEQPYPAKAGAAGELGEILAAGYRPAFGLFGAHLRHHVESDRLKAAHPAAAALAGIAVRSAIGTLLKDTPGSRSSG